MGRQLSRPKVILGAAMGLLAAAPVAGAVAPGAWELLAPAGPGEPGASAAPGLHRAPDGVLHVAWVRDNGPLDATLSERRFSLAGALQPDTSTIADHWVDLGDAAFTDEAGGLRVFFGGQQTVSPGTPLGLQTATQVGAGWSLPTQLDPTYGVVAAVGGTLPFQAFQSQSRVVGRPGLVPNVPLTVYSSGLTDGSPNVVREAAGRVFVAWCGFGAGGGGTYVQEVDPATGAPIVLPPTPLPGSATSFGGALYSTCVLQTVVSRRTPIAARAGGGVYVAGSAGYPTLSRVFVWRVGRSRLTAISEPGISHNEPQIAADPGGRIWVGWIRSAAGNQVLVVRRSNRAGSRFGAGVRVRSPGGSTIGAFQASATADHLDVIGQFSALGGSNSLGHTIVLPGLTLIRTRVVRRADGRRTVTYRVLDAGDPVAGVLVRVGSHTRRTAANGRVTFTIRGSLRATATKRGYTRASI